MKLVQRIKDAVIPTPLVERMARHGRALEAARDALAVAEREHADAALEHTDNPSPSARKRLDKAADALAAARRELETLEAVGRALLARQQSEEVEQAKRSREQKRAEAIKQGARLLELAGEADRAMVAFAAALNALLDEVVAVSRAYDSPHLSNMIVDFPLKAKALLGWQLPGVFRRPPFQLTYTRLTDCIPQTADLLRAAKLDRE